MIKIQFEKASELNGEIEIVVRSGEITPAVLTIMNQLETLEKPIQTLALPADDRVVMVAQADIILLEINKTDITIHTINHLFHITGQLKRMITKLNQTDFIQVSKGAVLNLNHLKTLEAAFSGNMTARLTNDIKVTISRKYLPELKKQLGM